MTVWTVGADVPKMYLSMAEALRAVKEEKRRVIVTSHELPLWRLLVARVRQVWQ